MVAFNPLSGWEAYARLQTHVENLPVGVVGSASDEALTVLAAELATDISGVEVYRRFYGHRLNRCRKYHERAKLDEVYLNERLLDARSSDDPAMVVLMREFVTCVRQRTTESEWLLLCRVASGESYSAIAESERMSEGQLRTLVCRIRAKLRRTELGTDCG